MTTIALDIEYIKQHFVCAENGIEYHTPITGFFGIEYRADPLFEARLTFGKSVESTVCDYLNRRGCSIWTCDNPNGKAFCGPKTTTASNRLASAPDRIVMKGGKCYILEIKSKTSFLDFGDGPALGIDKYYYDQYSDVAKSYPDLPFTLAFVVTSDRDTSKNGLFVITGINKIDYLKKWSPNNRFKGGVVYWGIDWLFKVPDFILQEQLYRAN